MGFKVPVFRLWNPLKRLSGTGSDATALTPRPVEASLAQGSGSLQAAEAISYGPVPLAYAKPVVPHKANVGKPINKHTHFVPPMIQRNSPPKRAKVGR